MVVKELKNQKKKEQRKHLSTHWRHFYFDLTTRCMCSMTKDINGNLLQYYCCVLISEQWRYQIVHDLEKGIFALRHWVNMLSVVSLNRGNIYQSTASEIIFISFYIFFCIEQCFCIVHKHFFQYPPMFFSLTLS